MHVLISISLFIQCRVKRRVAISNHTVYRTQYWTYYLVNCYVYADVVIQGIDFGGQPAIAFFGYAGIRRIAT